jgi:NIMA (never in mitosis gene a)-related kinase 1/4/5
MPYPTGRSQRSAAAAAPTSQTSMRDFKVISVCGKGAFANVYKVIRRSDNCVYALKKVGIGNMSKREVQDALNEVRFLASIRHPNIIGFLEAFITEPMTLCIVMEFAGSGDLANRLDSMRKKRQYLEEREIWVCYFRLFFFFFQFCFVLTFFLRK